MTTRYLIGDVFDRLAELEDGSVDLVVTSPPFLALRSYLPADHPDKGKEIGNEPTPGEFIDSLLLVTKELRRVLAPHGSIAVELGDTNAGSGGAGGDYNADGLREGQPKFEGSAAKHRSKPASLSAVATEDASPPPRLRTRRQLEGWPLAKSRCLIPESYRWALVYGVNPFTGEDSPAGSWIARNIVTWCRRNPVPGFLGDRWRYGTSDIVVATTSPTRYWDDLATRHENPRVDEFSRTRAQMNRGDPDYHTGDDETNAKQNPYGAPRLDWWDITSKGYPGTHYAVYPVDVVIPLVKAMAPERVCRTCGEPSRPIVGKDPHDWRPGVVLDPFAGTGTTLHVAEALGRDAIGIDIDERNLELYETRSEEPGFMQLRQETLL